MRRNNKINEALQRSQQILYYLVLKCTFLGKKKRTHTHCWVLLVWIQSVILATLIFWKKYKKTSKKKGKKILKTHKMLSSAEKVNTTQKTQGHPAKPSGLKINDTKALIFHPVELWKSLLGMMWRPKLQMSSKRHFQGGRVHEQLLNAMFFHLCKSLDGCWLGGYIMEILALHKPCFLWGTVIGEDRTR